MYKLHKTSEFEEWLDEQPLKARLQVDERLLHIVCEGHFGVCKHLGNSVWELKWANGRRIYYAYIAELNILLLLGGNKNGQSKDITQAKKILRKYTEATS
ncbi:MAG: type II toxin-antitoxin system RelE/ParE family toxin [Chlamydiota bacterium]